LVKDCTIHRIGKNKRRKGGRKKEIAILVSKFQYFPRIQFNINAKNKKVQNFKIKIKIKIIFLVNIEN